MSVELTKACLEVQGLSQPQKDILKTLCFIANENHEVYSELERLAVFCSCSKKTIERNMKILRDKKYLIYTNKKAPNSKSIPIYKINLTDGL